MTCPTLVARSPRVIHYRGSCAQRCSVEVVLPPDVTRSPLPPSLEYGCTSTVLFRTRTSQSVPYAGRILPNSSFLFDAPAITQKPSPSTHVTLLIPSALRSTLLSIKVTHLLCRPAVLPLGSTLNARAASSHPTGAAVFPPHLTYRYSRDHHYCLAFYYLTNTFALSIHKIPSNLPGKFHPYSSLSACVLFVSLFQHNQQQLYLILLGRAVFFLTFH
jgi:hypothetical protein